MSAERFLERWQRRAGQLRVETYALYLAYRDPRVPWYAKLFAAGVVGYALSPIDLIPDFIPVLGYLDDLVIIPVGVALALRMIPEPVMEECRVNAREALRQDTPGNWMVAAIIVAIWVLALTLVVVLVGQALSK